MQNKYCYNSPWCEPGEKCCCEAHAKFEAEEAQKKEEAPTGISDQTIFYGFCWLIPLLLLFAVVLETVSQ